MDAVRCDKVIQFALLQAGRQDEFTERELGPIHLLKYVYLADLAHAERNRGESFTGAPWVFYHYGPWALEVHERIEPALHAIGATKNVIPSSRYENDSVRWRKTDDELYEERERELPFAVVSTIRKHVREFGKDTGELLNHVYTTRPMLRATPRDQLVLFVAEPTDHDVAVAEQRTKATARQTKKRKERLSRGKDEIRAKLEARRAEREARSQVVPKPRYDEVFERGVEWLDHLASTPEEDVQVEVEFDDEVWTSDTRGAERD